MWKKEIQKVLGKGTRKLNIVAEVCVEREAIIVKFREQSFALYWNSKKGTLRARPHPATLLTLQGESPSSRNFLLLESN